MASKMVIVPLLFCFVPLSLLKNAVAFQLRPNAGACTNNKHFNAHRSSPRRLHSRVAAAAVSASSTSISSNDLLPPIREAVTEAGGEQAWKESTQILTSADLFELEEDAELCLADAYRWRAWARASEKMKRFHNPTLPDAAKVQEALTWLQEGPLELNLSQVRSCVRDYPAIYLLDPSESYRKVLGSAPRKYRDALVLKQLIEDDPNVLQVTYNCDGEGCASECGNCWVSYANRLPSDPVF